MIRRVGWGVGCPVPWDGLVGMLTLRREPVGWRDDARASSSSDVYVDAHGLVCSEGEDVLFRGFSEVMLLVDVDGALSEDVLSRDSDDGGDGVEEAVPVPRGGKFKRGVVFSELDGCWGLPCDVGCRWAFGLRLGSVRSVPGFPCQSGRRGCCVRVR